MPVYKQGVEDSIKSSLLTTIGDIIAASAVSTPARIAAPASGQVLTGQGAGVLPAWAAAATGPVTLLGANSGTSTTVAAHNLDTLAISGLTAKDRLLILVELDQVTQTAAGDFSLLNSTDSVSIAGALFQAAPANAQRGNAAIYLSQTQQSATRIVSKSFGGKVNGDTVVVAGAVAVGSQAVTTAWTGSWTLAYRSPGQTDGGTHGWSWAVYKLAGQ